MSITCVELEELTEEELLTWTGGGTFPYDPKKKSAATTVKPNTKPSVKTPVSNPASSARTQASAVSKPASKPSAVITQSAANTAPVPQKTTGSPKQSTAPVKSSAPKVSLFRLFRVGTTAKRPAEVPKAKPAVSTAPTVSKKNDERTTAKASNELRSKERYMTGPDIHSVGGSFEPNSTGSLPRKKFLGPQTSDEIRKPRKKIPFNSQNLGRWMDAQFNWEIPGYCFAASLLNQYQLDGHRLTEHQVSTIVKQAHNTIISWNGRPVLDRNGTVNNPDQFLEIAGRIIGTNSLTTHDTKISGKRLEVEYFTATGIYPDTITVGNGQDVLDSYASSLTNNGEAATGLILELYHEGRTHFVTVDDWDLSSLVDPHSGSDRSAWTIRSIRIVT